MSLLLSQNHNFVKITKLFLDSKDRENGDPSTYRLRLPVQIQNVIGASLQAYSVPGNVLPSFVQNKNDAFSFRLESSDGYEKNFDVVWAPKVFEYSEGKVTDYCATLESLLNEAIFFDPVFGISGYIGVNFTVIPVADRKTRITIISTGSLGSELLYMRLLFLSGPMAHRSAAQQMGFDNIDYNVPLLLNLSLDREAQINSPNSVDLLPLNSVDVYIKEFGNDIFGRLYMKTTGNITAENALSRSSLLQTPVRLLQVLNVSLQVLGQPIQPLEENEHNLSIIVHSLVEENSVPDWVLQSFSH